MVDEKETIPFVPKKPTPQEREELIRELFDVTQLAELRNSEIYRVFREILTRRIENGRRQLAQFGCSDIAHATQFTFLHGRLKAAVDEMDVLLTSVDNAPERCVYLRQQLGQSPDEPGKTDDTRDNDTTFK